MDELTAAQALRESEELHRITLLSMSDAVFITTDTGAFTFICPNVDVIFGYSHDEVRAMGDITQLLGRHVIERGIVVEAGEVQNIEHQVVTKRGDRRDLLVHVKMVNIKGGTMLYACRDVTEKKQADQELLELGGQLINAHEKERIRLSRELHDELGQRVALLSIELGLLNKQMATHSEAMRAQATRLAWEATEIGNALHRLSHNLHPARLEQLGLRRSIETLCHELSDTRQIAIDLQIADVPDGIGLDTSLCLYRIAQEALTNVVKHSGAAHAVLGLGQDARAIVMSIADDGAGFDPADVRRKGTLGLVSMRERARLVDATLAVTSQPGHGTRLEVRAPFR